MFSLFHCPSGLTGTFLTNRQRKQVSGELGDVENLLFLETNTETLIEKTLDDDLMHIFPNDTNIN